MSFFGASMNFLFGIGLMGIGFSVVVVVIAALNLVMDYDFIENGAEMVLLNIWNGMLFGLMVTLIWLYIEILRLLASAKSKRLKYFLIYDPLITVESDIVLFPQQVFCFICCCLVF